MGGPRPRRLNATQLSTLTPLKESRRCSRQRGQELAHRHGPLRIGGAGGQDRHRGGLRGATPHRDSEQLPRGWLGQHGRVAQRQPSASTYCSPVSPVLNEATPDRGPADSPSARANSSFFFDGVSVPGSNPSAEAHRREPAPRSPPRGRFERLFNAGDCLPSRHAPYAARELRCAGRRTRPFPDCTPSRPFRRRSNVTKNMGVLSSQCAKQQHRRQGFQCTGSRQLRRTPERSRLRADTPFEDLKEEEYLARPEIVPPRRTGVR